MKKHFAIALPSCDDVRSDDIMSSLCHLVAMSISYTGSARKKKDGNYATRDGMGGNFVICADHEAGTDIL